VWPAGFRQNHHLREAGPAATKQRGQLGLSVVVDRQATDPVKLCQQAVEQAKKEKVDVVILDTAGRLAIDEELMQQLSSIDRRVEPDQVYLVVDGMTGQDAVNSAAAFNQALELDGVILTKLDGDARGGAVLSVKHVTGVPVKFIGTGERLEALEPFRPEGMAQRILGMGDVVELVRTAQQEFDQQQLAAAEERMKKGQFTLEDFRTQLQQLAKPGLIQKMLGLLPGMGQLRDILQDGQTEHQMRRLFGIIDSMTPPERRDPKVIDPSRRRRIANGAGVPQQEVNELIKQFDAMASIFKGIAGKDFRERMKLVNEIQSGRMMDGAGRLAKQKKGTGKRLTSAERAQMRKQREKELRRRRRGGGD
jgi:signal recognition particle subunit SRP54